MAGSEKAFGGIIVRGPLTGKFFFDPKEERAGIILSTMYHNTTQQYHLGYGIPYEDVWESRWVRKLKMLDFGIFDSERQLLEHLKKFYPSTKHPEWMWE